MLDYLIVAGVNGAGKSTLYEVYPTLFGQTLRLNADEILRQLNGDWRVPKDNLAAMRIEVKKIRAALNTKKSLHVETTLAGNGHTQQNYINMAHDLGFSVTLLYVALANPTIAVKRVSQRVAKGGHGVPTNLIFKRYRQSLNNLPRIARQVDRIRIFANDQTLTLIFARDDNTILQDDLEDYPWLPSSKSLLKLVND